MKLHKWAKLDTDYQKKIIKILGTKEQSQKSDAIDRPTEQRRFHYTLMDTVGEEWLKRHNALNGLGKEQYREYLKSPEWEEKRDAVLFRDEYKCRACGAASPEVRLHVHHLTYDRKFNESLYDLVTLCETCHKLAHAGD